MTCSCLYCAHNFINVGLNYRRSNQHSLLFLPAPRSSDDSHTSQSTPIQARTNALVIVYMHCSHTSSQARPPAQSANSTSSASTTQTNSNILDDPQAMLVLFSIFCKITFKREYFCLVSETSLI